MFAPIIQEARVQALNNSNHHYCRALGTRHYWVPNRNQHDVHDPDSTHHRLATAASMIAMMLEDASCAAKSAMRVTFCGALAMALTARVSGGCSERLSERGQAERG
jgi:hypothetical protein